MSLNQFIAVILAVALSLSPARGVQINHGPVAAPSASTYHLEFSQGTDGDGESAFNGNNYFGMSFTASGLTHSIKRVTIRLLKVGSPTGTCVAQIWSSTGGSPPEPNAQLGSDSTTSLTISTVTGSYADYTFDFASATSLSNGTRYWIAIHTSTAGDGSNHLGWSEDPAGSEYGANGTATPTWTNSTSGENGSIKLYSFY